MNSKTKTKPLLPLTKFNQNNGMCWVKQQGDKEKSPKEKPFLTEDQKQACKKWCEDEKARLAKEGKDFYACFLDKKWFYVTSQRRKLKLLPAGPNEDPIAIVPPIPTARSRCFPVKVAVHVDICISNVLHSPLHCCSPRKITSQGMFLDVVANPVPSKDFDEKIFLQRVLETKNTSR